MGGVRSQPALFWLLTYNTDSCSLRVLVAKPAPFFTYFVPVSRCFDPVVLLTPSLCIRRSFLDVGGGLAETPAFHTLSYAPRGRVFCGRVFFMQKKTPAEDIRHPPQSSNDLEGKPPGPFNYFYVNPYRNGIKNPINYCTSINSCCSPYPI